MKFLPLDRMWERVAIAKDDSDLSVFMNLMYTGEMLIKCAVAGMTAAIVRDKQRNRYRALYKLVRADGLGEWASVLDEILTGPSAQSLINDSLDCQRELTQMSKPGSWQYEAYALLVNGIQNYGEDIDNVPGKVDCRKWFRDFSFLRNKTRAHGAPQSGKCAHICTELEESISLIYNNLSIFKRPWAYLHRNYSGRYRVSKITEVGNPFDPLKRSSSVIQQLKDGIYVYFGDFCYVELIHSDPDLFDFHFPNGQFTDKKFELLSYITDSKKEGDSSIYLLPSTDLPESETRGRGLLDIQGKCFGNLPPAQEGYINRSELESELFKALIDLNRYPIVTLVGRGGIGKTCLALQILYTVTKENRFNSVIWFSARDIDLLPNGPKRVKPQILDEKDIAEEFTRLVEPIEAKTKGFNSTSFLAENLGESIIGPTLFVFDNFETVKNPVELFTWIDTYIRLPNKVLITTRFRDFKADYPVMVGGMAETEAEALIDRVSKHLGIERLLTNDYREKLFLESEGHPYVIKIMLGEVAKAQKIVKVERVVADSEELLKALFERTYNNLSPASKRVFLTLCNWRSPIPQVALEAVLLRPQNDKMDVTNAIEELMKSSFIEQTKSKKDDQIFISVPLAAMLFGKKKLAVSPMKSAIEADSELLKAFGSVLETDISYGLGPRIEKLFQYVAEQVSRDVNCLPNYLPILQFVSWKYPKAWLLLASLYEETTLIQDRLEFAKEAVRHFLETAKSIQEKREAWRRLANYSRRTQDWLGEVHAWVELAQLPDSNFQEVSDIANRLNALLKDQLDLESNEKRILVNKILEIMEKKVDQEGTGTDYSRMAWLAWNIHSDKVTEYTEKGLAKDPNDPHIQSLARKLGIY